jgi:hypothetical protein
MVGVLAVASNDMAAEFGDGGTAVIALDSSPSDAGAFTNPPTDVPLSALLMKSPGFVGVEAAGSSLASVNLPNLAAVELTGATGSLSTPLAHQNLRLRI